MANRSLEWIIKLVDKVSGPAASGGAALSKLTKEIDGAKKAAGAADSSLEKLSKQVESAAGGGSGRDSLGRFTGNGAAGGGLLKSILGDGAVDIAGLSTGIGAAVGGAMLLVDVFRKVGEMIAGAIEKVGDFAYELTKTAVETAAFKEHTMIALSTVLGSDSAAKNVFGGAMRLGGALPFDTKEGLESTKRFAIAGISDPGTLQRLMVMTSDVKAFSGEEGAQGFQRQMIDMATVGMQERHLMFLSQQTGIREDLILNNIRKQLGTSASDKQIKEMITQGKVSKNVGFNAVAMAMSEQERGPIGTLSQKLGDSFDGLVQRLHNAIFGLFADFDSAPGFAAIKGVLKSLVSVFDPSSGVGSGIKSALGTAISGILTAVFGDLSGAEGKNKIQGMLGGVPAMITEIGQLISQVIGAVKGFAEGFMMAVGPAIDSLLNVLGGGKADTAQQVFKVIGAVFGGIVSLLIDMLTAAAALMDPIAAFRRQMGAGEGSGDAALRSPERLPGLAGQFHGAAPGLTVHQTVNVHADPKDARAIGREVGSATKPLFQANFGRMALSATGTH